MMSWGIPFSKLLPPTAATSAFRTSVLIGDVSVYFTGRSSSDSTEFGFIPCCLSDKIFKMLMSLVPRAVFLLLCFTVLPVHGETALAPVRRYVSWIWETWQAFNSLRVRDDEYEAERRRMNEEHEERFSQLEREHRQAIQNMQESAAALNDRVELSLRQEDGLLQKLVESVDQAFFFIELLIILILVILGLVCVRYCHEEYLIGVF